MRQQVMGWMVALIMVVSAAGAACGDVDPTSLTGRRPGSSGVASPSPDGEQEDPNAPDAPATDPAPGSGVTSPSSSPPAGGGDAGAAQPPAQLTCTSCHGDASRVAVAGADANVKSAPPVGTKGETATSARAVGAHQAHLNKGAAISNPLACTECHVVPTATNHSDGAVGITFGTLAKTGNKTPAWNGASCSASYCHGNFTGGNAAAAPAWTGGAMTCTSCHGSPPATGDHSRSDHRVACSTCHGTGYSSTTVNKALHINGVKNAGGAGSSITYNAATKACSPTCHGTETW